jgi:uncharacterized protein (DUF952 family)
MIYRIAEASDWARAKHTGEFASADLALEGFIHCSEHQQILRTAAKYYAGKKSLVLLEIDETKIINNLKREDSTGRGEMFPHIYAPIPLTAITRHVDFIETDGVFVLPF